MWLATGLRHAATIFTKVLAHHGGEPRCSDNILPLQVWCWTLYCADRLSVLSKWLCLAAGKQTHFLNFVVMLHDSYLLITFLNLLMYCHNNEEVSFAAVHCLESEVILNQIPELRILEVCSLVLCCPPSICVCNTFLYEKRQWLVIFGILFSLSLGWDSVS